MEAWEFVKDFIHTGVTIIGAIVSGLALAAWNNWRKEDEEKKQALVKMQTRQDGMERDIAGHGKSIDGLQRDHHKLDTRVQRHERNHVRLSTIVESLLGKGHPRIHEDEEGREIG